MSDSLVIKRVVKVGGSLLELGDLVKRLESWADEHSPALNVWVVGGGRLADQVRERHSSGIVDSETAHWQAVEAMEANTRLVFSDLPNWNLVCSYDDLKDSIASSAEDGFDCGGVNLVYLPLAWLKSKDELPHSWDVTSDSIAAKLALELRFEEVVLLKSVGATSKDAITLADEGIVDRYFPTAVAQVDFQIVNLRDA